MKMLVLSIMASLLIGCATVQQPFSEVEVKCAQAQARMRNDQTIATACKDIGVNCALTPEWLEQAVEHRNAANYYCGIVEKAK